MKKLYSYIDRCIIDEYATKKFYSGYSLDIDGLPQHERNNFLEQLMEHDTAVRDFVLHQMQTMINERLAIVEANNRSHAGLTLVHLPNGDTKIVKDGATW